MDSPRRILLGQTLAAGLLALPGEPTAVPGRGRAARHVDTWPMGDTPLVAPGSVGAESGESRELPARRLLDDGRYGEEIPGRRLRIWHRVDVRLGLEDRLALLSRHARAAP